MCVSTFHIFGIKYCKLFRCVVMVHATVSTYVRMQCSFIHICGDLLVWGYASILLQFNETITVTVLNEQLTEERVFYASLSPTLLGGQVEGGDATVIITPQGQRSQLLPLYIQTLEPFTSIEQLERCVSV